MGGLGKTTLANLVFGDKRIKSAFDLKLWVCVSDQDGAQLDVKGILVKILDLLGCKPDSNSSIQSLHVKYQRNIKGKRLLLVLDDVWNESSIKLDSLKHDLMVNGRSRIIATTRSMKMAKMAGGGIHKLQGLSDDNSRHLFEMVAFGSGSKPVNFIEIAEKIVTICSNVPLVIKVVGSLLYGQPIGIWQTFATSRFAKFAKEKNEIMSILKLSYDQLEPSLKSCFAYCAIFPKDYVISKEDLMQLWEAQGYIVPFGEGQSIENAGEEHFSVLLQRCFFQDVEKDEYGDVKSFKIHDLMHDLAQRVSGKEICFISSNMDDLELMEYSVRHLSVRGSLSDNMPSSEHNIQTFHRLLFGGLMNIDNSNCERKIRSHLVFEPKPDVEIEVVDELLTFEIPNNWGCLRALALQTRNVRSLPDTIGDLLHLRYLNLSHSSIRKLPDSIVKLHNLQTLNMNHCEFLDQWPKEFSKLVNLTHLHVKNCQKLSYMPVGMSKLRSIRTLHKFMVKDESASGTQCVGQLIDLKVLALNLKGCIHIKFVKNFTSTEGYDWEGGCLEGAKHLNEVVIDFSFFSLMRQGKQKRGKDNEVVMEKLKPPPNLRRFILSFYAGEKITRWGRARDNWATFLPNLVNIQLTNCHYLQELPMLSKLPHLKHLLLWELHSLEYMEEDVTSTSSSVSLDTIFFPSLKTLHITGLQKLKGWWKSSDCNNNHCKLAFPNLSKLLIKYCPCLISFPPCLSNPEVVLILPNKVLRVTTTDGVHNEVLQKLKGWWKSSDCNNNHCKLAFPNLSKLLIKYCPCLISFPPCLSNPEVVLTLPNEVLRVTTADGVHNEVLRVTTADGVHTEVVRVTTPDGGYDEVLRVTTADGVVHTEVVRVTTPDGGYDEVSRVTTADGVHTEKVSVTTPDGGYDEVLRVTRADGAHTGVVRVTTPDGGYNEVLRVTTADGAHTGVVRVTTPDGGYNEVLRVTTADGDVVYSELLRVTIADGVHNEVERITTTSSAVHPLPKKSIPRALWFMVCLILLLGYLMTIIQPKSSLPHLPTPPPPPPSSTISIVTRSESRDL